MRNWKQRFIKWCIDFYVREYSTFMTRRRKKAAQEGRLNITHNGALIAKPSRQLRRQIEREQEKEKMKRLLSITIVSLLAACTSGEPDEERYIRMRVEQTMAQANVMHWERKVRPYLAHRSPPDSLLDSLIVARRSLALANREINAFMRGQK